MIETNRLLITKLNINMAYDIHVNSLDEDTKKYVPDEVFESVDVAKDAIEYLISRYDSKSGPFVYPIIIKDTNENIGYVELVKMDNDEYEIHIPNYKTKLALSYEPEHPGTRVRVDNNLVDDDEDE